MNYSFLIQAGLWGTSSVLSALAVTQYLNFRRKEKNLPAACEFEALETELALRRSQLREANETIGRAQIVLTHAEETRKWIAEQKSELTRIEADRKAQEGLRAEVITQQAKLDALMSELARAGKEIAAEEAKVVNLATQKAQQEAAVEELKEQLLKLQQEIADRALHLNAIRYDINQGEIEQKRLLSMQELTEKALTKAKVAYEATLTSIDEAKRKLADTETKTYELEQKAQRLQKEIDSLEVWKNTLTALLQKIEADLKRVHPQATGEDRYRDLWEPVPFEELPVKHIAKPRAREEERLALERTSDYLKSHSLQYPKRVLGIVGYGT